MKKIFTFIVNDKKQFLLLQNNPKWMDGDYWYTVTGEIEKSDKTIIEAVIREIKEETHLDVAKVLYLNWVFKYNWHDIKCVEFVHIAFVNDGDIILNEENTNYTWCNLDDYINNIWWYKQDKTSLRKVLEKAINEELFFTKEQVDIS